MTELLYLFPDTNILLHYPPLFQVDWCGICDAEAIKIVVCLTVIHELDAKKSDPRLASRAERAIKEIRESYKSGQPLRENVSLTIFNQELRVADFPDTLSPDCGDDRIVHFAKLFETQNSGQSVAVATEDLGMELRCETNRIAVVRMDTSLRLENPADELTRKYKTAINALNALKNRLPDLILLAAPCGQLPKQGEPLKAEFTPKWQPLDVKAELAKQRQAHPKGGAMSERVGSRSLLSTLSAMNSLVSEEDWARYNKKLDNFLLNYELYLQRLNVWGENKDRTLCFDLWLGNSGNAPAEDIDAFLMLPSALKWVAVLDSQAANPLEQPEAPEPPERPQPQMSLLSREYQMPFLSREHMRMPQLTPTTEKLERLLAERDRDVVEVSNQGEKRGHSIHGKIRRLKHGDFHRIGSFLAVFGSWEDIKPFNADYTLSASELPERVTGTIPFIVRAKTSPS